MPGGVEDELSLAIPIVEARRCWRFPAVLLRRCLCFLAWQRAVLPQRPLVASARSVAGCCACRALCRPARRLAARRCSVSEQPSRPRRLSAGLCAPSGRLTGRQRVAMRCPTHGTDAAPKPGTAAVLLAVATVFCCSVSTRGVALLNAGRLLSLLLRRQRAGACAFGRGHLAATARRRVRCFQGALTRVVRRCMSLSSPTSGR